MNAKISTPGHAVINCVVGLTVTAAFALQAADLLTNANFEEANPTNGWEVNVYGAPPRLELDSQVAHGGKQALRVSALDPSDTALAQDVTLNPTQWYRFSAWIRTAGLESRGARITGTVQVQHPKGAGVIAGGSSHAGDTAWTNVSVCFLPPPDGRVRLCLFYAGFGCGVGTAWFDDIQLDEISPGRATIQITREPLVAASINPMQYGQFVEYLCDLVPAMWAEKLYDGSFEGLSRYNFAFIQQTDFKEKPWYPSGAVNRGLYTLDKTTKVSGEVSQKIAVEGSEPCTLGLSQDGLFVERDQACVFKCWLRADGLRSPVRVKVFHEDQVYAQCEFTTTGEWKKYEARLVPSGRDVNATLSLEFRGPGTVWLENASLMPVATVGGWRPDVVEAVRGLRPHIIRIGGSVLEEPSYGDFDWKGIVGDPDHRRPFHAWGGLQPTGPGLGEFVQFCRTVEAEPLICVRFSNRTPHDAAEEVEYFNGSTNTPMGALRMRHGHPKPYAIKYWQVGNERQSKEYDERVGPFCQAMKAVDPSIRILSSFPTTASLHNAGAYFDYVCPHHYTPDLGSCADDFEFLRQILRREAPNRPIKVGVTEWNTTAGDWGLRRAMLMTLANALSCSRYQNLLHRNCDLVEIANRSNLINSFGSGIIQADNHRLYKTPTYYAQSLYATLAGQRPLRIESSLPTNVGLDLSATLTTQGETVTLFAVNDTLNAIARPLDFSAFGKKGQRLSVWTLADHARAGEPDVRNSFGQPERISPERSTFRANSPKFNYRFPALSLTILQWQTGSSTRGD